MTEEKKATEEKKEEKTEEAPQVEEKKDVKPEEAKKVPQEDKAKEEDSKKEDVKKEETKKVKVPARFKLIVEEIGKMSVLDLSELVKILEDKFNVSSAAPMAAVMPGAGGVEVAGGAEEKTSFNVELTEVGANKIAVIKAIRTIIQLGLKEAKDMTDSAPKIVIEGADKEKAEEAKKVLEEAGAKVTLK